MPVTRTPPANRYGKTMYPPTTNRQEQDPSPQLGGAGGPSSSNIDPRWQGGPASGGIIADRLPGPTMVPVTLPPSTRGGNPNQGPPSADDMARRQQFLQGRNPQPIQSTTWPAPLRPPMPMPAPDGGRMGAPSFGPTRNPGMQGPMPGGGNLRPEDFLAGRTPAEFMRQMNGGQFTPPSNMPPMPGFPQGAPNDPRQPAGPQPQLSGGPQQAPQNGRPFQQSGGPQGAPQGNGQGRFRPWQQYGISRQDFRQMNPAIQDALRQSRASYEQGTSDMRMMFPDESGQIDPIVWSQGGQFNPQQVLQSLQGQYGNFGVGPQFPQQ